MTEICIVCGKPVETVREGRVHDACYCTTCGMAEGLHPGAVGMIQGVPQHAFNQPLPKTRDQAVAEVQARRVEDQKRFKKYIDYVEGRMARVLPYLKNGKDRVDLTAAIVAGRNLLDEMKGWKEE